MHEIFQFIKKLWGAVLNLFRSKGAASTPTVASHSTGSVPSMSSAPSVAIDFLGSARRHMRDANLLEASSRVVNSGHLLGFGAECGIKALMLWLGYPKDAVGEPIAYRKQSHDLRVHVDELSNRITAIQTFILTVSGRSGTKYLAMIPNITHFADWRVAHRYYREANIPNSFASWKAAAAEIMLMLDQATKDGMT